MQTFKSKVDTWLMLAMLFAVVCSVSAAIYMLSREPSFALGLNAVVIALVGGGFPLWVLNSTRYKVSADTLYVFCGPLKWQIAINTIHKIEPSRNPISSPALSLDRLLVTYEDGKQILVSPVNQVSFLNALGRDK